jgi:predicted hotdog family 3-hydroxylacyl-ACP dehydratase
MRPVLPHAPPMHWLDDAQQLSDGRSVATRSITADHPFVHDGHLLPSALIELMAQAAATASIAAATNQNRKIRRGVLASIRDLQIIAPIPVGSTVTLFAAPEKTFGNLTLAALEAWIGKQLIATARMTFHLEFE